MDDSPLADLFLVDSTLISQGGQQYELLSGIDEEGPFIELWLHRGKDAEQKIFFSYWFDDKRVLTLQSHQADTPPSLEELFVAEADKLIPMLSERISRIPSRVRWLYQTAD